jgi:hypothetical protein
VDLSLFMLSNGMTGTGNLGWCCASTGEIILFVCQLPQCCGSTLQPGVLLALQLSDRLIILESDCAEALQNYTGIMSRYNVVLYAALS